MLKKFSLFACITILLFIYSVTANAFEVAYIEPTEEIIPNEQIQVKIREPRVIETVFALEYIPYDTVVVETEDLPKGQQLVHTNGSNGELLVISRIVTEKAATYTESKTETVMKEPVSEVIHFGIGESFIETEEGLLRYTEKIDMSATAYCLCEKCTGKVPGQRGYGITASGLPAAYGVVAVDSKVIPLGTKLYIEGYGVSIAGDTGKGIKGNKVDLFFDDYDTAIRFGRQKRMVYILADQ